MKKITEKQIEILKLIYPGPVGGGMKVVDAAKKLGISKRAAFYRLISIKKNFPEFWEQYLMARRVMRRQRTGLKNATINDEVVKSIKFIEFF